ncbi:MAG TPA: hypothetical protein VK472_01000 [Allosphingosinicella sp.]|nr:hypothetical protein [Allosphingosinicella sp.]
MKQILAIAAIGLLAGGTALASERGSERNARVDTQAKLDKALRGYEQAGPAMSCVNHRDLGGNKSVGDAILFSGHSGRLFVNRPAGGCTNMNFGRTLVTRTSSARLCRGDIATVVDPVSGFSYGGCGLGDFVPYKRVRNRG